MPDHTLTEDDAALYVLGGLSTAQRLEFEARLAESEQLRALVRDLEEGAAALALTTPLRRPPADAWRQIEKSLSSESNPARVSQPLWLALFRNGWAAAAACLAGWLLYVVVSNHQPRPDSTAPTIAASQSNPALTFPNNSPSQSTLPDHSPQSSHTVPLVEQTLDAQKRQNVQLRREILQLQSRLTNLSHSLAGDDALLAESNRFKISVLNPANSTGETPTAPSPELQRAIFAALARQLGWQPASASNGAVQFVDLRPGASNAPVQQTPPPNELANESPEAQSNPALPAPLTNNLTIPSLSTRDGVILALGPSAAPAGSQLNITIPSDDGSSTTIPFRLGDSPTVLTVPGGSVITLLGGGSTVTNWFQFFTPTNPVHP